MGQAAQTGCKIINDRRRGALIGLAVTIGRNILGRVWYIQIVANEAGTDGYAGGGVEGDSGSVVELKEINSNGKSCIR